MPAIKNFIVSINLKVEIFALCSKTGDVKTRWDGVETLGMKDWINTTDPEHKSRFRIIYDVKTTPQVYILDKDKRILTKKIELNNCRKSWKSYLELKQTKPKKSRATKIIFIQILTYYKNVIYLYLILII